MNNASAVGFPNISFSYFSSSSLHFSLTFQYESDEIEKNVYQEYDSDSDVADELKQDFVDEQTGDIPNKRSVLVVPSCVQ